jgi:hypothetical protein
MGVDPLKAESLNIRSSLEIGTPKKARPRPVSITRPLREAAKAGLKVTGATIEDGRVTLTFGEPVKTGGNELDQWMAENADNPTKGH